MTKHHDGFYTAMAASICFAILGLYIVFIWTVEPRQEPPVLAVESSAVYDVEGVTGEVSWALCRPDEPILRGSCMATESGQKTTSEPMVASGRLGWACLSDRPVRAIARCMGHVEGRDGLAAAVAPITGAWALLRRQDATGMTLDYYSWRTGLDSCLDALEPEGEP